MIVAIIQARMSSTRLPGKVLMPILGKPMILHQLERIKRAKKIDKIIVATSQDPSDEPIVDLCNESDIPVFCGSLADVLDRYYQAAIFYNAEHIMRLTADCPLIEPSILDSLVNLYKQSGCDYASNTLQPTYPDGLDAEILSFSCLEHVWKIAKEPELREHVTLYILHHPEQFKISRLEYKENLNTHRWTVDYQEDFTFVTRVYQALYPDNPAFGMEDVVSFLAQNPEIYALNQHLIRNGALKKKGDECAG